MERYAAGTAYTTGHARRLRTMGLRAALWSEVCTAGTAYGMRGASGCERGKRVLAAGHGVYGGGVRGGVPSAWCVMCAAAGMKKMGARSKTLPAACVVCGVHGSGCEWRAGARSRTLRPWGAACEVWRRGRRALSVAG